MKVYYSDQPSYPGQVSQQVIEQINKNLRELFPKAYEDKRKVD